MSNFKTHSYIHIYGLPVLNCIFWHFWLFLTWRCIFSPTSLFSCFLESFNNREKTVTLGCIPFVTPWKVPRRNAFCPESNLANSLKESSSINWCESTTHFTSGSPTPILQGTSGNTQGHFGGITSGPVYVYYHHWQVVPPQRKSSSPKCQQFQCFKAHFLPNHQFWVLS